MEWPKVTQILEARLDGEEDPSQRLELLRRLGDLQESHLEDLDGALETYGRLFAEDPHESHSQETLTRLARALGRWDRLAAIFDKTLRAVDVDDAETAALALTTAKLTIKAAHMKLSHSRMPFVRAYHRETQELVFDAHDKAFLFYGGVCRRGIYDNMKTAVEAIFVGKARQYNRRFLQMCSHHLIEPVACTPAAGWEKGQVENQVGNLRDRLFRPKPRVKSLVELNAWLEDQCIAYAKRTRHPEFKDRTVWDVYQDERASLMELRGPFDGFVEKAVRATTTCLIMADRNRYSVDARAAGRMVLVRSHAERIVVLFEEEVVADHSRQFRHDQIIYDPWHYLPVLVRKPGALRNGAPFKDWNLPLALAQVRAKLKSHADGDRQFVKVLGAVLDHGLAAVEAACAEALEAGIASGDVVLAVLARRSQPPPAPSITTPDALRLKIAPLADCGRYDSIRKVA